MICFQCFMTHSLAFSFMWFTFINIISRYGIKEREILISSSIGTIIHIIIMFIRDPIFLRMLYWRVISGLVVHNYFKYTKKETRLQDSILLLMSILVCLREVNDKTYSTGSFMGHLYFCVFFLDEKKSTLSPLAHALLFVACAVFS